MSVPRVRFAPPGSGGISLSVARTALFSWLFARSRGGVLVVRLDRPGDPEDGGRDEQDLIDDLHWLGLGWDEGIGEGGPQGPYRHAERMDLYRRRAEELAAARLAYRCFCPGAAPHPARPTGQEDGCTCRCRALDRAAARRRRGPSRLRLNAAAVMRAESVLAFDDLVLGPIRAPAARIGDPVLIDRTGRPGLAFAVAVDDREMAITHLLREGEPLSGPPVQILLSRALGAERGPVFAHLPPLIEGGGAPADGALAQRGIGWFRERGYPPEALINALALMGWSAPGGRDLLEREEILDAFDLGAVSSEPVLFDRGRIDALSARHMARLPESRLVPLAIRHLQMAGRLPDPAPAGAAGWVGRLIRLFSDRLVRMADLPAAASAIFDFEGWRSQPTPGAERSVPAPGPARRVVASLVARLDDRPLTAPRFQQVADEIRRETGLKGIELYDPLRMALTGAPIGPDLVKLLPVIEEGHRLDLAKPIASCAERARAMHAAIGGEGR